MIVTFESKADMTEKANVVLNTYEDASCRSISVRMEKTTDAFTNQLRWAVARDVPTLSLGKMTMLQTSPFPDEYIAHRVGLMPFKPKNPRATEGVIHLNSDKAGRVLIKEAHGDFEPLAPNAIVTNLPSGCFIKLTGHFDVGLGKSHQRYNHVAAARVLRHSRGFPTDLDECWCKDTPAGQVCMDCAGTKNENPNAPVDHILCFETFGHSSPEEVLRQTLIITIKKLRRIISQLR